MVSKKIKIGLIAAVAAGLATIATLPNKTDNSDLENLVEQPTSRVEVEPSPNPYKTEVESPKIVPNLNENPFDKESEPIKYFQFELEKAQSLPTQERVNETLRHNYNLARAYEEKGDIDSALNHYISIANADNETITPNSHRNIIDDAVFWLANYNRDQGDNSSAVGGYLQTIRYHDDMADDAIDALIRLGEETSLDSVLESNKTDVALTVQNTMDYAIKKYIDSIAQKAYSIIEADIADGPATKINRAEDYFKFLDWLPDGYVNQADIDNTVSNYTASFRKDIIELSIGIIDNEIKSSEDIRKNILKGIKDRFEETLDQHYKETNPQQQKQMLWA